MRRRTGIDAAMFIKNYTSGVPVPKTVSRIEELLAKIGAKAIGKDYKDSKVVSITFQLEINGQDHLVRLPANPNAIFDCLRKQVRRPHNGTLERLRDQAERTAWKLQQDWLEVELTNIHMNQKHPLQCFLAYIWDGQRTYFDVLQANQFKALPESVAS